MQVEMIQNIKSFNGEQRKYQHNSEMLQCTMTFSLYLPHNPEKKELPLIWWLSGLTCTDDNFSQKSGFQRLADKYQVAVIIPDTEGVVRKRVKIFNWDFFDFIWHAYLHFEK